MVAIVFLVLGVVGILSMSGSLRDEKGRRHGKGLERNHCEVNPEKDGFHTLDWQTLLDHLLGHCNHVLQALIPAKGEEGGEPSMVVLKG